ncbi:class I adenylate-forming enzyme family protein [Leucobacter aridicollis]|uniref:class I adenylate-forming enzyme family protein n=1 Tax=Leucobacter aridicollis TaxID=283878 RepID=UPI00216A9512|nr:AMP-binding protein [Leucobacter aridicollis]MCS3427751.1 fatty-acyl-CoA synthase [Leucobacter aridicollis]
MENTHPEAPRMSDYTIGNWLADRAAIDGARIAIDDRGVLTSYHALNTRARALASRLAEAGYGAGGRIATVSGNSTDHVVAFFACAILGIAFIPLSWRLTAAELGELIRRSRADLLLVEDEYAGLGEEALAVLRAAGGIAPPCAEPGLAGVEQWAPPSARPLERRDAEAGDPLLVVFTSGSEAAPKGVVLTHRSCFWTNLALSRAMPMTSADVVLSILPQHHVAAWNVQPLLAWWVGATVVLERSFQPGRVLQLIRERKVTAMMGVPTQYQMLFAQPGIESADLRSLSRALVGGSTIPEQLAVEAARLGLPLAQGYGLTEAGPNVLHLQSAELAEFPGAVGRPYPSVETAIVDTESGLPLADAATGELWVRGPSLFSGYLDDDAATERAMSNGWLRTGDIVARDAGGIHRVVDRVKNIYVSGGENVAPAEVEAALCTHPLVEAAAVVGVPDPVWGERGYAFIVTAAPVSRDELLAHARTLLAPFKLPAHVEFVDELPRSTIEKVARGALADRARTALAAHDQTGTA